MGTTKLVHGDAADPDITGNIYALVGKDSRDKESRANMSEELTKGQMNDATPSLFFKVRSHH